MTRIAANLLGALPLLGLLVAAAAGCPLAHDHPAPTRCFDHTDCFAAAGEYCDKGDEPEGVCRLHDSAVPIPEPGPDMPKSPDMGPGPDGGDLGPGPDGDLGPATDADLGPAVDADLGPGPDSGGTNG